jgi:hypothetical protein
MFGSAEATVPLAMLDNSRRQAWSDARQLLQFNSGRRIDVNKSRLSDSYPLHLSVICYLRRS